MTKDSAQIPKYIQDKIFYESEDSCWEWKGYIEQAGYGRVKYRGHPRSTHRLIYELLVGPIPEGLQIDHLCRNRKCCNPRHLEAVTPRVNTLRGETITAANAQKTHCSKGHPLAGDNLVIKISKTRLEQRVCRICRNADAAKRRANFTPEQAARVKELDSLRVRDYKAQRASRTPEQIEKDRAYERKRWFYKPDRKSQPSTVDKIP